ncbi:MAG: hypothetical protein ACYTGQ_18415, partial [Planctomycetota bacterium]
MFDSAEALKAQLDGHLARGVCFLSDAPGGVAPGTPCTLRMVLPSGATKLLTGRVVFQSEAGTAVEIDGFFGDLEAELLRASEAGAGDGPGAQAADPPAGGDDEPAAPSAQPLHQKLRNLSGAEQLKIARQGDA